MTGRSKVKQVSKTKKTTQKEHCDRRPQDESNPGWPYGKRYTLPPAGSYRVTLTIIES